MSSVAPTGPVDPLLVPRVHEVVAIIEEIPDVVTIRCVPVDGEPFAFVPAQIGMVGAFGIGEAAISISSPATESSFHEYTIRRAGAITSALTRMRPGDQFWVRGPFGAAWDLDLDGRDIVLAAGGIGLAPLRSAVYAVIKQRERYGAATLVVTPLRELVATRSVIASAAAARANGDACAPPSPPSPPSLIRKRG